MGSFIQSKLTSMPPKTRGDVSKETFLDFLLWNGVCLVWLWARGCCLFVFSYHLNL